MQILVTGSAGHLGEALVRVLSEQHQVIGIDQLASAFTHRVGSIIDAEFVRYCMSGIDVVLHAATLHKPHVATHSRQAFIDTNVTGTLNLLEAAVAQGVRAFVYTSTTSVFGDALVPPPGQPAAWITEQTLPVPKNIYGVTKRAAEDLCELFHRNHGLNTVVLRTSRFFPEEDDRSEARDAYSDDNLKINEYLYRRVDLADAVEAHRLAFECAPVIGFDRFIISSTSPLQREDLPHLRDDAEDVVAKRVPGFRRIYAERGFTMLREIDRVYVNARARERLGWRPRHDFVSALAHLERGEDFRSPLARAVGSKGYHADRRYPFI